MEGEMKKNQAAVAHVFSIYSHLPAHKKYCFLSLFAMKKVIGPSVCGRKIMQEYERLSAPLSKAEGRLVKS